MSRNAVNYIMSEFGRIACRESGAGRPLLLTQRFRATMDDWDPELIAGRASRRRIIRFDNAGIGRPGGQVPESVRGMADAGSGLGVPGAPEQDPRSRL
jgi:pimeloyl-ACP methyl ester carboxylesterase